MKKTTKTILITLGVILVVIVLAGMYKFNYLANKDGYDVDGNKIPKKQDIEQARNEVQEKEADMLKKIKEEQEIKNKDLISLEFNEKVGSDKMLDEFLKKYVAENGDAEFEKEFSKEEKTHFGISKTDLNNDGEKEVFVKLEGTFWCGTAGCPVLLLQKTGNTYKIVNDFTVVQGVSVNEKEKTNGWKNLVFISADGGSAQTNEVVFQKHIQKYDYLKF